MPEPVDRVVAFRCDGNEHVGAGHVARCLPLAGELARRGHVPVFVGAYSGLARWLLERARLEVAAPVPAPAGLDPAAWSAAVVDSYTLPVAELCVLARALPVAFLAEARRCPDRGVHVDYHADAPVPSQPGHQDLRGPAYTPIDPAFAALRRSRSGPVRRALVTVGGSTAARRIRSPAVTALRATFPAARILVAGAGAEQWDGQAVTSLPHPSSLLDVVADVDVAVSGAGLTASELAAAGVPTVIVAVAHNQRRVTVGFAVASAALTVDLDAPPPALAAAVAGLADPALRVRLSEAGPALVDGRGAQRTVSALTRRWGWDRSAS